MPYEIDAHSGGMWFTGTGIQDLTAAQRLKLTVTNPPGALGHAVLTNFFLGAEDTFFLESFVDPTGNLPTTNKSVHNAIWDGRLYDGGLVVKADVSNDGFSGGTMTSGSITVGPDGVITPFEIQIPPGHTFGWQTAPQPGLNRVSLAFSFVELI